MGVSYKNAERLVRTELNFVSNMAARDSLQAAGLEEYEYIATAGPRTCGTCSNLNGTVYLLSEFEVGTNAPPMHPRCRCTISAVVGKAKVGKISPPIKYSFGQKSNSNVKIYGGVECTINYAKEKFYNGKIERDCIIYTTAEGTKFFFPKDLDIDKQTMTPNMAIGVWQELPAKLRAMSQNRIAFLDIYNPDDEYWIVMKGYKNFEHAYATSGEEIIFWIYEKTHQENYLERTYCHEIAHFIDGNAGRYSSKGAWLIAMKSDELKSRRKSVTKYSENSASEDFADSVAEYFVNRTAFVDSFPARTKLLKEIFENG